MQLNLSSIKSLRDRIQSAVRRADQLTTELCPAPTRMRIADDVTALVDLMLAEIVDSICGAEHVLQQALTRMPSDGTAATSVPATTIALIARAKQKVDHSVDLLNAAQQMVDGDRTIWGEEIRHGAIWDK